MGKIWKRIWEEMSVCVEEKQINRFLNLQFYSHSCFFQMSTQIIFIITQPLEANTACAAIKLVQQIINGRSVNTALCALEEHTQHLGHNNFSGKYI